MIMKIFMRVTLVLVLVLLLCLSPPKNVIGLRFNHGNFTRVICSHIERDALLKFKHDLKDPSNQLGSWAGDLDCCGWVGVVCDNVTGHVIELHLRSLHSPQSGGEIYDDNLGSSMFGGKINPFLLNLKHLRYLDLSNNDFGGTQIPKFFGSMGSLKYLDLSNAGFGGTLLHQLGNLSNLHYLNLHIGDVYESYAENLNWLFGLSSLKFLDLSRVDLSKSFNWLEAINSLPSLTEIHLSGCQLTHVPPLPNVNSSSLSTLDLSDNDFVQSSFFQKRFLSWVIHLKPLVSLNLAVNNFQGPIPNGLQNLTSLRELDLSYNQFNSSIPKWLYGFNRLEFLTLQENMLQGKISSAIGNMTSLISLDLSFNDKLQFEGGIPASLKNLCNLRVLHLSGIELNRNIGEVFEIVVAKLESLELDSCQLFDHLTNHIGQFKNLANLVLSNNSVSGPIPLSLGELESLRSLYLDYNELNGTLPNCFGGLKKLEEIDISNNLIFSPMPTSFGELASLRILKFSKNKLNGSLPAYFQMLPNLETIDISYNSLAGEVSKIHFTNLTKLSIFIAGGNQLVLRVSPDWIPPLQLRLLDLRSWNVGPRFPSWIRYLKFLSDLSISNSSISSTIPIWFWNMSSQFKYLNLSHNQIHGLIPNIKLKRLQSFTSPISVDLSSNHFKGTLPLMFSNVIGLDLSNNSFSGSISNFLCHKPHEVKIMQVLNLGENLLSGEIPNCWMSWEDLVAIKLSNNKLNGHIPTSIGNLRSLESLHLRNNNLSGELPTSLKKCIKLVTLDVGENALIGNFPTWIGEGLTNMVVLNLRANKFHGLIHKELCNLFALQILDLAHNHLSGSIPTCVNNFRAMTTRNDSFLSIYVNSNGWFSPLETAILVMKGKVVEYSNFLKLVRSIDLSHNALCGEIPWQITSLGGLLSLNLSQNFLIGKIPKDIGAMQQLESIDFSLNQLSGEIPSSMSSLTFLSHLNLSDNKLWGKIPSGTQLQSFDPSSFMGNELCGPPLSKNCSKDDSTQLIKSGKMEDGSGKEINWFYVSIALGFIVGFWSVVGTLFFNRGWRLVYFHFLDRLGDKIWWYFHVILNY